MNEAALKALVRAVLPPESGEQEIAAQDLAGIPRELFLEFLEEARRKASVALGVEESEDDIEL
jgi:hypothetical protein